jgi:DNA-binding SARP family transcriptional activator
VTLGQAEIHTRGIRLTPESELQFGLALYFCAQAGREVPRDEIVRLFWPTHGLEAGRHCLRQAIYRLRVLGVAVRSGAKATVLETHYIDADFAPAAAEGAPASVYLRLTDVSILPGYSPRFSRPFANWVEDFRTELGSRIRRGLVRTISEMRARGRYADVERLCKYCLRVDPLNEEATLALAEAVALAGGKAEAVGMIDRYEGEIGHYRPELRLSAGLLRERISDRLIRRSQAAIELPMVGRDRDVERVLTAFQRLRGSRAVSYVITGSAGVGKTRLAFECCRMAQLQGARLLTIGTQPSSRTQALFAVSELVDGLLQMPGAIGCAPAALDCLKDMSSPMPQRDSAFSMDVDGEARLAMVRWSILDVLDAILSEGPLLIHVDDAHQLDTLSLEILEDAKRTHSNRPLLLLFTMRPSEPEEARRFVRLIDISVAHELLPLSDANCDLLVQRFCAVNEDSLTDTTRERIIQLSGGNPFFLVELLKHRSDLVADELPVTVQALLEDRLTRLSGTALTVLRAAAVLGLSSTVERLHRMVERKTSDILLALSELHSAGMLSSADGGTQCRHDTIREAVLERTPTPARSLLHRRAARTLGREALRDGGVGLLWECVHHWRNTDATRVGVRFSLVLAKRLLRLGLATDALDVLKEVDSPKTALDQRRTAQVVMAFALRMLRDWQSIDMVTKHWRTLHEKAGRNPKVHSRMELVEFECHYNRPVTFGTLPHRVSECISAESATTRHRLAAATLAMISADNNGDEAAAQLIYRTVEGVRPKSTAERIDRVTTDAVFHTSFGELERVPSILRELLELAQTLTQPALRATHIRRACFGIARYDSTAQARTLLLAALETFEQLRLWSEAVVCIEDLGIIALSEAKYDDAQFWIGRATEMRQRGNDVFLAAVEYELRVLLAFERMDADYLPTFSLPVDVRDAFLRPVRSRQIQFALRAAQHIVAGEVSQLGSLLIELETLHQRMRRRGYQDFIVAVLTTGLSVLDRKDNARALLESYLRSDRRELVTRPPAITRIASQLNIAD